MARLEDLKPGAQVNGILPQQTVTIVDVTWHGTAAVEITYKRADGEARNQLLYRRDEANLSISQSRRQWAFTADGDTFKLTAEAFRIHLAHLFDPVLAVHTSLVEALPHQITAVYGEMLARQPLRYLLADDPGAGKTIMAGLLIKELMVRGDVRRCLSGAPGSLAGQWQDELWFKFQTHFEIFTRETLEASASGNPFQEKELVIIRLDQVARSEELQAKLSHTDWDLVIVDEAHKMSASFWGSEMRMTKRYRLGELLGSISRHFLLMTATPHNGKEEDFQMFLRLIDPDRFENRSKLHNEPVDVSDIMRRMVKEDLRRFDGRPLFPERRAYTVNYQLSPAEQKLYQNVTEYVRTQFNRGEQLLDDKRQNTVGFALTVLQRRLASSPKAIYQSLRRRLFASDVDYAARDVVLQAFSHMYRHSAGEFPSGVAERDYYERMVSAYPIHPELFDRLYQDWSTLERFQRTRGVLRLMAAVIHQLWKGNDASLLIMPGTILLAAIPVRNELLRYLPDTWTAVFDKDVDGSESLPLQIDGDVPALGRYAAARRVARTVFLGSAPSVAGQRVRGLEEIRVRLGCAQPGEPTAVFGDALRRMGSLLTYLYSDGSRTWYDTRPTVNRLAQDRAQAFPLEEVRAEMIGRLKKVPKNREFAAFHIAPPDSGDVVDEARVRLVVLPPEAAYKRRNGESEAIKTAQAILESRGSAQRLYKNMLLFVAPDESGMEALATAVREFMAWRSIQNEEEALNLDAQQRRQVKSSLNTWDETVELRLREAYSWLLTPVQPEPLGKIEFQANRISGDDNFYDRAARKLRQDGLLINEWSPDILRMELDRTIWGEGKGWTVGFKQLWAYLAQYCYLPRLFDQEVLLTAVRNGIRRPDAPLAYATGVSPEGYHTGLLYQSTGQVYFDDQSILIHPDHVKIAPPPPPRPGADPLPDPVPLREREVVETGASGEASRDARAPVVARYYGRVDLNPQRVNREMGLIVEEVIERLTSLVDCEVEISLEISARLPDGFDEATIRTVGENSRTLKFEHYEFETD